MPRLVLSCISCFTASRIHPRLVLALCDILDTFTLNSLPVFSLTRGGSNQSQLMLVVCACIGT